MQDDYRYLITDSPYKYNNNQVARVTKVLHSMISEDYIAQWANSLGYKRLSYKKTLEIAAEKGTITHSLIETFLKTGNDPIFEEIHPYFRDSVKNAYCSFKDWWKKINDSCLVEIIYSEHEIITPAYGGTIDLLIKIDNEYYLIDFKTSNNPSFKYFIQLASYKMALEEIEHISARGCIILQLSKTEIMFYEYLADYTNDMHKKFMSDCFSLFQSLLDGYYKRLNVEKQYKEFIKKKGE